MIYSDIYPVIYESTDEDLAKRVALKMNGSSRSSECLQLSDKKEILQNTRTSYVYDP